MTRGDRLTMTTVQISAVIPCTAFNIQYIFSTFHSLLSFFCKLLNRLIVYSLQTGSREKHLIDTKYWKVKKTKNSRKLNILFYHQHIHSII